MKKLYVGKVIGNVVATVKDPTLTGVKLLVVQLLDDDGNVVGDPIVAADAIGVSGEGDFVYLAFKREAAIAFPTPGPVDAAITGFIDEYHIKNDKDKYRVGKKKSKPTPRKKKKSRPKKTPVAPDYKQEEEE